MDNPVHLPRTNVIGPARLGHYLKCLVPRSLYGRAAVILILPALILHLVISTSFIQRLYEGVTVQMTENMAAEIGLILDSDQSYPELEKQAAKLNIQASRSITPVSDSSLFYDLSGRVVSDTLHDRFPDLVGVDLISRPGRVRLSVNTSSGSLDLEFSRRRVTASNPHQLLVLMTFTAALMTLVAYLFLRQQLRPVRRLAAAAEAFGRGQIATYHPSGAAEMKSAGRSFLQMRDRIEQQKEQRSLMLSGVSHDLRTPLTRLKLGLSMYEDTPENRDLLDDLGEMERLINTFLEFVRSDATEETQMVDPVEIAQNLVRSAEQTQVPVRFGTLPDESPRLSARPKAIRRALGYLVDNAVRYGSQALVSVQYENGVVRLRVEDDGPGIPRGKRKDAIKPFARLDAARNQNLGSGVGLGLSIATDTALSHGGKLELGESEQLGGLCADILLPA